MAGAAGQRLHLRLFLEGIEVPVIAAQIQSGINAPAAASIQVVPHDAAMQFKPRTMVHLFYYDPTNDLPDVKQTGPLPAFTGYRLLYGGEIVGLTYTKTPLGRQLIFHCSDFSTYWDTTYQMFLNLGPNGNFFNESSAIYAGGNAMFNSLTASHVSVLNDYLKRKPVSDGLQNVKGLMGGIISLLEAMGGVANHVRGVNDFFTIAELKNHIMQQIVAEQDDDTAQRLFDGKAFMQWLTNGMTSAGELVTFRDMLKLLFKWIYYEVIPITCPRFVKGTKGSSVTTTSSAKVQNVPAALVSTINAQRSQAVAMAALNGIYAVAAHVNTAKVMRDVLSPIITDGTLPKEFRTQVELALLVLQEITNLVASSTARASEAARISKVGDSTDLTAKQQLVIREVPASTSPPLVIGAPRKPGEVTSLSSLKATTDFANWDKVVTYLNQALFAIGVSTVVRTVTKKTKAELDHLNTQIFRPDCFFASPPKCNVIFPEQATSFSFTRQYLQEITRLRLGTSGFLTGGGLFGSFYFAPVMDDIRALAKKQGAAGVRALLPWEVYSGILPKIEHCSEINYMANKAERQTKKNVRGQANSYAQRAANFNYFKYRFAARSADVSMKFNPGLVLGFPALVIDKPWIVDPATARDAISQAGGETGSAASGTDVLSNLRLASKILGAPLQYLGMVTDLTHNVDQSGGVTSIRLSHARTHRITDDDFLSIYSKEIQTKASEQLIKTTLNLDDLQRKGDLKLLRMLIDATPQEIPQAREAVQQANQNNDIAGADTPTVVSSRPSGLPNASGVVGASAVAGLTGNIIELAGAFLTVSSDASNGPLSGGAAEADSKTGRGKVLEPSPYGKLKAGSKGPKGGIIVQIQLTTDRVKKISDADISAGFQSDKAKAKAVSRLFGKANTSVFAWEEITILEKVKGKPLEASVPPEEAIRPPWFSPLYSSFFIGERIYQPFFGCGALVDEAFFSTPGGGKAVANQTKKSVLVTQLLATDGDVLKIARLLDQAKKDKTISDVPSVELAADAVAFIYGEVRRQDLDVHRFVADYTARPVATFEEILGSADLEYKTDPSGTKLKLVSGTPGFHSTAVLDVGNLLGLLDNPDAELPRLRQKGKKAPVSKILDPRPGRRKPVLAYVAAIQAATGTFGVGLVG